jgi:hypothetical protein
MPDSLMAKIKRTAKIAQMSYLLTLHNLAVLSGT